MLDIGCGSGLHSLAALRLGAARVHAIDLDRLSVETTRDLLGRYAAGEAWTVEELSVFDMAGLPQYDIVYSWGVLHHTGAMRRAIGEAAARVAPGGLLCLALYRRTPFCGLWRIEKRLYCASPAPVQRLLRGGLCAGAADTYGPARTEFSATCFQLCQRARDGLDDRCP
ncbi:MAG: class I SAM-dependent methyltransferase [Methylobacterium sp.]|nr:class I SAM-dependent methyltransferase [Roseomonas sp.]MCA3297213.1 class I SAM-dependent methyltransferase [Roseomonas sp.]MCA3653791.1 class I SAM-dependent methyltransferase [Methylobacterium sp.]